MRLSRSLVFVTGAFPLDATVERVQAALTATPWPSGHMDLLKALPGAVYTTDAEGRITFYNDAAAQLWGCTRRSARPNGAAPGASIGPMAGRCRMTNAQWRWPLSKAGQLTASKRSPNGRTARGFPSSLTRHPFATSSARCSARSTCSSTSPSDNALSTSRPQLASIVESSDDAIVSKDLNGVITSWNRGAERLFGYTADEIVGKPVTILIPADRHDEEPEILGRIRRGERIDHYETVRRRKDGSLVDISLTVSPVKDAFGRIVGASKIARDITERKRGQYRAGVAAAGK